VEEWIAAGGEITVRGEMIAVQVPDAMVQDLLDRQKGKS
jgi:hypothetical protein